MQLRKTFRFEASHILPRHPGKCSRLHGHSWVLHVFVEGPVNPSTGFVCDYAEISSRVKPLVERLDHHHLGAWVAGEDSKHPIAIQQNPIEGGHEVDGLPPAFYPTSENLLHWIGDELFKTHLKWSKLALEETCTSYAELTFQEWVESGGLARAQ